MAYYLSKRNKKLLEPYLKLLESNLATTKFKVSNPEYFHSLLRSAFNTSHPHLRPLYALKSNETHVTCEYLDIQISIEIDNVVTEPVDEFAVATDILASRVPVKYTNAFLDITGIQALASTRNLTVNYNPPILEITNG